MFKFSLEVFKYLITFTTTKREAIVFIAILLLVSANQVQAIIFGNFALYMIRYEIQHLKTPIKTLSEVGKMRFW